MIYLLIAGTYTPLSLLALHGAWRVWILSIVWAGAAVGITLKFLSVHGFTRVTSGLYIALGWLAIAATPQIVHEISPTALALMIAGGLFFTGGVIVLGLNRPNPIPGTFGYHEVWHACTMAGTACHYGLILLVVLAAR
jgi:hemolysin III